MSKRDEGFWWVRLAGAAWRPLWLCDCGDGVLELWTADPEPDPEGLAAECVGDAEYATAWGPYLGKEPGPRMAEVWCLARTAAFKDLEKARILTDVERAAELLGVAVEAAEVGALTPAAIEAGCRILPKAEPDAQG